MPQILSDKTSNQIRSFDQFWLYYLRQHADPTTRAWHFTGISAAITLLITGAVLASPWFVPAALLVGYAFAMSSHYLFAHNHPASYQHPLWSFISMIRMFRYSLSGRLEAELKRAGIHG